MIGFGWLIDRARKKAIDSLRWRVFFAIGIVAGFLAVGWLIVTWTVLR